MCGHLQGSDQARCRCQKSSIGEVYATGGFLIQLCVGKIAVGQTTEKQFSGKIGCEAAAAVLLDLYNMGATAADLQRCKNSGARCFGFKVSDEFG